MIFETMDDLEIGIVKSKGDIRELHELRRAARRDGIGTYGGYFGIGRVDGDPVGYWEGVSLRDVFSSVYIFVNGIYRNKGFGSALKEHQLDFARGLGCNVAKAVVPVGNYGSFAVQRKYGAVEVGRDAKIISFETDLR